MSRVRVFLLPWLGVLLALGVLELFAALWPYAGYVIYLVGICLILWALGTFFVLLTAKTMRLITRRRLLAALARVGYQLADTSDERTLESIIDEAQPSNAPVALIATNITLSIVVVFVVCFSEFCRYWSFQFGGFETHGSGYWYWIMFGISWLLDNVLANFSQIFGFRFTDISPNNITTEGMLWGYNIALEFIVIAAIFRGASLYFQLRRPIQR
jgi:hypothetical protein